MRKFLTVAGIALAASCSSPRTNVTKQDAQGNYITTSEFNSMEREDFRESMRAGLADFDQRMAQLRKRANELGGDHLSEFADWSTTLEEKRTSFNNELEQTKAVLANDWPDQRAATLECYYDLRECLDEAYNEVLEG